LPSKVHTPLPTSSVTSGSAEFLHHPEFLPHPCGRDAWEADLIYAASLTLEGDVIRTDGGVRLCQDCAVRCWLQEDTCEGFVFKPYQSGGEHGACTYYSRITGHRGGEEGATTVSKNEFLANTAPVPAPSPSSSHFVPHPCGQESGWQSELVVANGMKLQGNEIRTDYGVHICRDCAVRCWLMMPATCKGIVFKQTTSKDVGSCTYFSSIDGVSTAAGEERAVTTVTED